jgi:hypothetical protein
MSDATGAAEALLGLPGFRVLGVEETAAEVIVRIETTAEVADCPRCGVVAVAQGPDDGRVPRSGRLRPPGSVGVAKAPLALSRAALLGQDLDRDLALVLLPLPPDPPRGPGVLPAGRPERAPGRADGARAWRLVGHGDGRGHRARRAPGRGSGARRPGAPARRRRDHLAERHQGPRDALRDRDRGPGAADRHRRRRGKRGRGPRVLARSPARAVAEWRARVRHRP